MTRPALVLALIAWEQAGALPGDRIEHASVLPLELVGAVRDLGLQVVTQPAFLSARGDDYLREVEADDVAHLYRCGSLLDAGVGVAASTDAPYGPADPWQAMRAAVERRSASGTPIGPADAVAPRRALGLFLGPATDPGGPVRRVTPGSAADLCLLDAPLRRVVEDLSSSHVVATWIDGSVVHGRSDAHVNIG